MIRNKYYQLGYDDPVYSDEFILNKIRQLGFIVSKVTKIDESGGEARVYVIDDQYILKVQRPQQLRRTTSLKKEVFFLNTINNQIQPNLLVPQVLAYIKENLFEAILLTKIKGSCYKNVSLSKEVEKQVLIDIGKNLAHIHQLDVNLFKKSKLIEDIDDNLNDLKIRFKTNLRKALKKTNVDRKTYHQVNKLIIQMSLSINDEKYVALHSNPGPTHNFVGNDQFTGLIDFADAYISHPVFDLRKWPTSVRNIVYSGYQEVIKVSNEFNQFYEVCYQIDQIIENLNQPLHNYAIAST